MNDSFNLGRFVDAQAAVYRRVVEELSHGRKQTHWMRFIFPQIAGLGSSAMAQRFAIGSRAEAVAKGCCKSCDLCNSADLSTQPCVSLAFWKFCFKRLFHEDFKRWLPQGDPPSRRSPQILIALLNDLERPKCVFR